MTTIAFRDGVLAADSRETSGCEDSGQLAAPCDKIFRVGPFVVALQGDTTPGMIWLNWFRTAHSAVVTDNPYKPVSRQLLPVYDELVERMLQHEADFTAVVLCPDKRLFIYDEWGFPQRITAPYYAVGSGSKVAYGALFNGASATAAVEAACAHDPYTSLPVHSSEKI